MTADPATPFVDGNSIRLEVEVLYIKVSQRHTYSPVSELILSRICIIMNSDVGDCLLRRRSIDDDEDIVWIDVPMQYLAMICGKPVR